MVAYYTLKCWLKVVKESIDLTCKHLYHISDGALREVGKTLHNTELSLEYKLT